METIPDIPQYLFDEGDASDIRGMTKRIQSHYGSDMQVEFYCDGTNVRVIVTNDGHEVGLRIYAINHDVSRLARRNT
jgi:hypothetical protein